MPSPVRPAAPALFHGLDALSRSSPQRRTLLRALLAGAAAPLAGCGGSIDVGLGSVGTGTSSSGSSSTSSSTCSVIPEETAGPYPADGSNANSNGVVNALTLTGVVRSDIRSSFAGASAVATGIPLTLTLQLVNAANSCANLAGYALYLWHCDRNGLYSLYDSTLLNEDYLRGVQVTDSNGQVSFTTIFPGCYAGRMPHIHFEIYPSLSSAVSAAYKMRTSQLTFPLTTINEAYATSLYSTSAANLSGMSFAADTVFSDGTSLQMASVSGSASSGYTASLVVAIST